MASPFSIFRKHQRVSLAVITFLAMFAFVFSGVFSKVANGPTGVARQQVAATWKFGKISTSDVEQHMRWTAVVNKFLLIAWTEAVKKGANVTQYPPEFPDKDRTAVLQTIVLAKKAELMGITVSDDAINQYIDNLTDNKLSTAEKERVFASQMGGGSKSGSDQLFDELRFQLLADHMRMLMASDASDFSVPGMSPYLGSTPAGQWDYFSRVSRQATIEALPVDVKAFVSQVPDPSQETLQQFFDKYKQQLPQYDGPEPGFKIPPRGEFQYFQAVRADFVKQEKPKVTDAQIKEYYDAHKESFRRSSFNFEDEKLSPPIKPEKETPKEPKTGDKSKTEPKSQPAAKPKAGESEKPKADATKPEKSSEKSKDDKPADGKEPAGKSSFNHHDRSSFGALVENRYSSRPRSRADLLAMADPEKSDAKAEPPKAEPAKPAAAKSEPAKQAPAKEPPTVPAKGDAGSKASGKPASEPAAGKSPAAAKSPAAGKSPADDVDSPGDFDPVDSPKVRDQIRETLATQAAGVRINGIFKKLRPKVSAYSAELSKWRGKGSDVDHKPPPPDFKAIAKDFSVEFHETGLVSARELSEKSDFGKSYYGVMQGERLVPAPVDRQAFAASQKAYQTGESEARDGENAFLWWRVDALKPAEVPENLDSVRGEVLQAWKMIEARKLAEAKAAVYAAEVNRRHISLKEAYLFKPNMAKVVEPPPFPWLTVASVPRNTEMQETPPQLRQVKGLDRIGPDFMHTVFNMDVGSAGVAFNHPRTVAYVVQLQDLQPRETTFRGGFLNQIINPADTVTRQALLAAQMASQDAMRAKILAIEREFDFKAVPQDNEQTTAATSSGGEDD